MHNVTAVYFGDSNYLSASSNTLTHTVSTTPAATLSALSTRGLVGTGDNILIGGFIIGEPYNKTVVVRGIGPSLASLGIANALANPTMQLVRSIDQATIAVNDDWGSASNAADLTAIGFAPSNPLESAILINLPPGSYTALVSGAARTSGVGMVEIFEVDHPEVPLVAISARGQVLTGDGVMIGGFIIQGTIPRTVVVRARGPSLTASGVPNVLSDPNVQLVRSSDKAIIATNDNYTTAPNLAELQASGFAPSNAFESAILVTLDPGAYTAIVNGVGGATGIAIVEVFGVPLQ
jgi:hypothetical protein